MLKYIKNYKIKLKTFFEINLHTTIKLINTNPDQYLNAKNSATPALIHISSEIFDGISIFNT